MKRLAVVMRDGQLVVTDAETGEQIEGVWRVELCATGSGTPMLTLFLDPWQHSVDIETASVRIDRRHRPVALSRQGGYQPEPARGPINPPPKRL